MNLILFVTLLFTLLRASDGQEALQGLHYQAANYFIDSSQSSFDQSYDFDSSLFSEVFEELDIEDDNHATSRMVAQSNSTLLVVHEIISIPLFPSKRVIKLYILFHSWKSYLPI